MNQILLINACVRPESRTFRLAAKVLEGMEGTVEELNLEREAIAPLTREVLEKRMALQKAGTFSDPMFRYAKQFAAADELVIAAPYWDLSFPASVKGYIEAVSVGGVTFTYTPTGEILGLCRAKRLTYVTTAGGPLRGNLGYGYIKAMAETLFGIKEIRCVSAENLDITGNDAEAILQQAMNQL